MQTPYTQPMAPAASESDQYFHSEHYQKADDTNQLPTPPDTLASSYASLPPTPSEGALAGRKRSREDIYSQDHGPTAPDLHGLANSDGSTMTVLPGAISVAPIMPTIRPIMPTRKSQRLDLSTASPNPASALSPDAGDRSPVTELVIDEASQLLGISWTRMDSTETSQIRQRAYTRWINRHYPNLTNVEVWFENAAIPGYLGKATNATNSLEEYYLWSYDLHQAILVTRNPRDLVFKLSQPHMSLSQATEKITADVQPVVEAAAANAAIVHNDRFFVDEPTSTVADASMDVD